MPTGNARRPGPLIRKKKQLEALEEKNKLLENAAAAQRREISDLTADKKRLEDEVARLRREVTTLQTALVQKRESHNTWEEDD